MKSNTAVLGAALCYALSAFASTASAAPATAASLAEAAPAPAASPTVSDCWIRLLPANLPAGGYFKVANPGAQPVDLVGVTTAAFGMAMLHQTQTETGMSKMVMVNRVAIPAHGTLSFTPGNYHLMLEQPRRALKVGMTIPITFSFSSGAPTSAMCAIKSAGAVE